MARIFSGLVIYDAPEVIALNGAGVRTTTESVLTRNALGDISYNQIASQAVNYEAGFQSIKRPFFNFAYPALSAVQPPTNETQNIFGNASGGPINPFSGGSTSVQFEQPPIPWGIAIVGIFAVYSVATNDLDAAPTLGLSRIVYVEGAALAVTALIAATAISAVHTASGPTTHVALVAATTPLVFESLDFSDLNLELALTTDADNTARVYALGFHVAVRYA
jgi:hypothetical protein